MSKNDEIIIITAARPGLWMRERFSPSAIKRWMGETFYKDYGKTMEKLRQIDDAIYEWVNDIEQLYKELKERQKQPGPMDDKRVIDIARLLGGINRRFKKIDRAGDILEDLTEIHLQEFENQFPVNLPEDGSQYHELSEEDTEELEKFRDADDMMLAEAGFWDDLRQKWLTRKMETQNVKQRRKAVKQLIDQAGKLVRQMKGTLKNLSKARASGDVGQYLDALNTISEEQQNFENSFVEVYNTHVREHVDKMLEEEAPDTTVDPQTGESVQSEGPQTIEEEIVEDLGGELEPGETSPQDPEEWMASQILEEDMEEIGLAPTQRAPEGMPSTIPGMPATEPGIPSTVDMPGAPETIPSAPMQTDRIPSARPESIDVELPESWDYAPSSKPKSIDVELPESWDQSGWQPPSGREVIPQSNQPATKPMKQEDYLSETHRQRPPKKVRKWEPPAFKDIFVQDESMPQTQPGTAAPQDVGFEGISPSEMNVDEISSGKGTARTGPAQVQLANAIKEFFNKTSRLSPALQAKAMLSASEKFENFDDELSTTFLSLAEQILENAE